MIPIRNRFIIIKVSTSFLGCSLLTSPAFIRITWEVIILFSRPLLLLQLSKNILYGYYFLLAFDNSRKQLFFRLTDFP